jgi:hypothetical protein
MMEDNEEVDCDDHFPSHAGFGAVDVKDQHTKPESTVRQAQTATASNQGVRVSLSCKLTRNRQTVKFESLSAGFPNNSHIAYRQDAADTKMTDQIG